MVNVIHPNTFLAYSVYSGDTKIESMLTLHESNRSAFACIKQGAKNVSISRTWYHGSRNT